jgi:hypothetical protein
MNITLPEEEEGQIRFLMEESSRALYTGMHKN